MSGVLQLVTEDLCPGSSLSQSQVHLECCSGSVPRIYSITTNILAVDCVDQFHSNYEANTAQVHYKLPSLKWRNPVSPEDIILILGQNMISMKLNHIIKCIR